MRHVQTFTILFTIVHAVSCTPVTPPTATFTFKPKDATAKDASSIKTNGKRRSRASSIAFTRDVFKHNVVTASELNKGRNTKKGFRAKITGLFTKGWSKNKKAYNQGIEATQDSDALQQKDSSTSGDSSTAHTEDSDDESHYEDCRETQSITGVEAENDMFIMRTRE